MNLKKSRKIYKTGQKITFCLNKYTIKGPQLNQLNKIYNITDFINEAIKEKLEKEEKIDCFYNYHTD